jgi:diaminohydroxyphosphoribosylaminopyrimidine deaminase/5-amino-6-(5-phosphoribosylamino)uracil reductase
MMDSDERIMRKVFQLARKGSGTVSPNPLVGAILVRNGKVVGSGYHRKPGTPHAEIHAIHQAGNRAEGGTLYLNLEPCCHTEKKTPPCTEAILNSGIRRVVIAMRDPNPQVNGKGLRILKKRGIEVREGVLKEEAELLNEIFTHYIKTGVPFVALKIAATLDGKIANSAGISKWITGDNSREFGHHLRNRYDAILVGKGTVLADNPELTTRLPTRSKRNPVRIVIDEDLTLPLSARVYHIHPEDRVIIATTERGGKARKRLLEQKGITVIQTALKGKGVHLSSLLKKLGKMEISSVLIEGGSGINGSAIQENLVNKVYYLAALKFMGGTDSISAIGGQSPSRLSKLPTLKKARIRRMAGDLLIEGYLK